MKKSLPALLLATLLLLTACTAGQSGERGPSAQPVRQSLQVTAATYPVYLLTTAITQGVEGIEVSLMLNQPTSCLHDYSLSSTDMKALERADIILLSGAGLEDFMGDALAGSSAAVIDSSAGISFFLYEGHDHDNEEAHAHDDDHDHDHDGEDDPHIWMDPARAAQMAENIGAGLAAQDPDHAAAYQANTDAVVSQLTSALEDWREKLAPLTNRGIITFHDGFRYFAHTFDLELLKAIEEEEGAEASAKEIREISELIKDMETKGSIPGVFTEVNGSDATAKAISRETGVSTFVLSMIMSGEGTGLQPYLDAMDANINTILEALG